MQARLANTPARVKTCTKCDGFGPFAKNKNAPDGLAWQCKKCSSSESKAAYRTNPEKYKTKVRAHQKANSAHYLEKNKEYRRAHPEWALLAKARSRAKAARIPFNLTVEDVVIPDLCPLLVIPLVAGTKKLSANSPTLDRKVPALGYIRGNVWVISHRANTVKNNATLEEIELLARNLRAKLSASA